MKSKFRRAAAAVAVLGVAAALLALSAGGHRQAAQHGLVRAAPAGEAVTKQVASATSTASRRRSPTYP